MSYIAPNSTIRIYKNIPLDNTYEDTIYFASASAQRSYFSTGIQYTLDDHSYQRVNNNQGQIKVEILADNLYTCNYMAFQNTNFGNKWFYAFITNVEYINNATSLVTFEIDDIQTYMFDYELLQCFVEREHSATDEVGDNILPENLNIGDYRCGLKHVTGWFNEWGILVQSPYNLVGDEPTNKPDEYCGVPNANAIQFFQGTTVGSITTPATEEFTYFINHMNDKGLTDSICFASLYPTAFVEYYQEYETPNDDERIISDEVVTKSFRVSKATQLGSYVPKNKKLLTYPYTYLCLHNSTGDVGEYKYEYFNDTGATFDIIADPNTCSFLCVPTRYNTEYGVTGERNYDYALLMNNLPQVNFSSDTFKIWWAQNKVGYATGLISQGVTGAASAIGSAMNGNAIGAGVSAVSTATTIANTIGEYFQMKARPDYVKGNAGTCIDVTCETQDFWYEQLYIQEQYAKSIDDYFTMYGYATKQVKVPNRNVRPHWTYTKTIGCKIIGNCPTNVAKHICEIYDKGITFWKNPSEVGNYALDNTIS